MDHFVFPLILVDSMPSHFSYGLFCMKCSSAIPHNFRIAPSQLLMEPYGILWNHMEWIPWNPMETLGILWNAIESYGIPWNHLEICEIQSNHMNSYGILWIIVFPHEFFWTSTLWTFSLNMQLCNPA